MKVFNIKVDFEVCLDVQDSQHVLLANMYVFNCIVSN